MLSISTRLESLFGWADDYWGTLRTRSSKVQRIRGLREALEASKKGAFATGVLNKVEILCLCVAFALTITLSCYVAICT